MFLNFAKRTALVLMMSTPAILILGGVNAFWGAVAFALVLALRAAAIDRIDIDDNVATGIFTFIVSLALVLFVGLIVYLFGGAFRTVIVVMAVLATLPDGAIALYWAAKLILQMARLTYLQRQSRRLASAQYELERLSKSLFCRGCGSMVTPRLVVESRTCIYDCGCGRSWRASW